MAETGMTATDEMLLASSHRLGSTRMVQVLWTFPAHLTESDLNGLGQALDRSRLSRVPRRRLFPGGRRAWTATTNAQPLTVTETSQDEQRADWADEQIRRPLPESEGHLWRLSAHHGPQDTLLSLVVPHFRSDGHGLFAALQDADSPADSSAPRWWQDVRGTGEDLLAGLGGAAQWARELIRGAGQSEPVPPRDPIPQLSEPHRPQFFNTVWLEVDTTAWDEAAHRHGASPNSLFVEVAANIIRALPERHEIVVGVPVSTRTSSHDRRANALIVVPVPQPGGPPGHSNALDGRARLRTALQGSDQRRVTVPPEPLWQLLPRPLAARLIAGGAQQTDVVASNFGQVAHPPLTVGPHQASRTAVRSMNVPGVVPAHARLTASLVLITDGSTSWLTATALPAAFGSRDGFAALVHDELAAWGLTSTRWL